MPKSILNSSIISQEVVKSVRQMTNMLFFPISNTYFRSLLLETNILWPRQLLLSALLNLYVIHSKWNFYTHTHILRTLSVQSSPLPCRCISYLHSLFLQKTAQVEITCFPIQVIRKVELITTAITFVLPVDTWIFHHTLTQNI